MTETTRKGARSFKDISPVILAQLNAGQIESANLVEWLAIDLSFLMKTVLVEFSKSHYFETIIDAVAQLKKPSVTSTNAAIGKHLLNLANAENDQTFLQQLATHKADAVRCWACYAIGGSDQLDLKTSLNGIKVLAADHHFGVREVAWLAMRHRFIQNLEETLDILKTWSLDENENIRRFASEATRPRGVWCAHIEALKVNPELALVVLEPLKNDPAKYVQDSVGNWLNDASKASPKFVMDLCKKWQRESDTKATQYIIKKALRTLNKV